MLLFAVQAFGCGRENPLFSRGRADGTDAGGETLSGGTSWGTGSGPGTGMSGTGMAGTGMDSGESTGSTGNKPAICGDGVVEGDEQCDDGNTADEDGCRSDCTNYVDVLDEWKGDLDMGRRFGFVDVAVDDVAAVAVGRGVDGMGVEGALVMQFPHDGTDPVALENQVLGAGVATSLVLEDDIVYVAGHEAAGGSAFVAEITRDPAGVRQPDWASPLAADRGGPLVRLGAELWVAQGDGDATAFGLVRVAVDTGQHTNGWMAPGTGPRRVHAMAANAAGVYAVGERDGDSFVGFIASGTDPTDFGSVLNSGVPAGVLTGMRLESNTMLLGGVVETPFDGDRCFVTVRAVDGEALSLVWQTTFGASYDLVEDVAWAEDGTILVVGSIGDDPAQPVVWLFDPYAEPNVPIGYTVLGHPDYQGGRATAVAVDGEEIHIVGERYADLDNAGNPQTAVPFWVVATLN
jgi:cysteine-rich repeat protein